MAKIKIKAQHAAIKHRGLMFASPSIRLLAEESRNVIFHCTRNNPVIKWLVHSAHKPGNFYITKKKDVLFLVCVLGRIPAAMLAQDPRALLATVSNSMGADNLKTLRFSAMGSGSVTIGQNINPRTAWPVARIKSYSYEADFARVATHRQFVRQQNGAEQAIDESISADSPWNAQYDYWLSPFAFIKAAIANNASVRSETTDGARYSVVTFALQGKYKFIGYINEQNLVERVQTWIDNDV